MREGRVVVEEMAPSRSASYHPHQLDLPRKKSLKLKSSPTSNDDEEVASLGSAGTANSKLDREATIKGSRPSRPNKRRMQTLPLPPSHHIPSPHTSYRLAAALPSSPSARLTALPSLSSENLRQPAPLPQSPLLAPSEPPRRLGERSQSSVTISTSSGAWGEECREGGG
ncbi:hypothetical protein BT69DRAFT_270689 [Atractiella rhizophila]|nr:hypothetical protein BT69DRAFT_270689 [Atractiella rhizophila]